MKKILAIAFVFGGFLCNSHVLAGDTRFDRSAVIGAYLASSDMTVKMKASNCGYIFKKAIPTFKSRLIEVQNYLSGSELKEINNFVASPEFIKKMAKNQEFIDGYLLNLKKDGIDDKTACGLLVGLVSAKNVKFEKDWNDMSGK